MKGSPGSCLTGSWIPVKEILYASSSSAGEKRKLWRERRGRAQGGGRGGCKLCVWPRREAERLTRASRSPQGKRVLPFSNPGLTLGNLQPCDSRARTLSDFPWTRPVPPPEARSGGFGALLKSRELGSPRPATRPSRCRDMPQPPTSRRTREEVDATLQVAKLNTAELLPTVHCLSFGPGTSGAAAGDFCLLELEPALCQQLEAGHR